MVIIKQAGNASYDPLKYDAYCQKKRRRKSNVTFKFIKESQIRIDYTMMEDRECFEHKNTNIKMKYNTIYFT